MQVLLAGIGEVGSLVARRLIREGNASRSGTVYPSLRSTAAWGQLTSDRALVSADRGTIRVPAPQPGTVPNPEGPGRTRRGEGWTLELAPGWRVRTGPRRGDFEVVREPAGTAHP